MPRRLAFYRSWRKGFRSDFNGAIKAKGKQIICWIFVWDIQEKKLFRPSIKGFQLDKMEKNWSPFTVDGVVKEHEM
jgi:hypothetical protein